MHYNTSIKTYNGRCFVAVMGYGASPVLYIYAGLLLLIWQDDWKGVFEFIED